MRSSTLLSALFVAGAFSSPIIRKRDYVTEYDIVTVVAYVTEDAAAAAVAATTTTAPGAQFYQVPVSSSAASTTPEAPAPAAPTTTIAAPPPPPPASSEAPAAAPSSSAAAAPAPAPVQQAPAGDNFQSNVLYYHNVHRANHSADPLQWNETLASAAQELAARCVMKHDTNVGVGGYGQNLLANVNTTSTGAAISGRWYNDEMPLYQDLYGQESPSNANFPNWGHFSQMVWKETTSLGCYTQYCPGGVSEPVTPESPILVNHPDQNWNTVCNYSPAGNSGQYTNVGRPLGHESLHAAY